MLINGNEVDTSPERIIQLLQEELESEGTYLFRKTKSLANNYQFSCPFHGGGNEQHPSCGMTRERTWGGGKVYEAGTVHCFTCGYTADLIRFISEVLGRHDGGFYGNQWLKRHFQSSENIIRPKLDLNLRETRSRKSANLVRDIFPCILEEELDKYRWYHPYMEERGLEEPIIEMFDVGYDKLNDCITFPVRDMEGRTIFFNRRSVRTKFHKYGESDPKTEFLYGEYELSIYKDYFDNPIEKIYVVESIINCLTLWKMKIPAVALMGVGGGSQIELLKNLPVRNIVLALDPDDAGQTAQLKIHSKLKRHKMIQFLSYPQEFFDNKWDINDHPELLNFNDLCL